jgi:hypothetical protein
MMSPMIHHSCEFQALTRIPYVYVGRIKKFLLSKRNVDEFFIIVVSKQEDFNL